MVHQVKAQRRLRAILALVISGASTGSFGCASQPARDARENPADPKAQWPTLTSPVMVEPGVTLYELKVPSPRGYTRLWVYLPYPLPQSVPAVLIAPAGSPLIHGMSLGIGDRPEHLPYVRAGFAVIAFDIEGAVGDGASDKEVAEGMKSFEVAEYGVADARLALDYALAKVKAVDPSRVVVAGHSSAATLSLLVAAKDERLKGCISFAPACDVEARFSSDDIEAYSQVFPAFRSFLRKSSPMTYPSEIRCPVFIFHADDDRVVSTNDVAAFVELLSKTNSKVTFVQVREGGHYDSMIREGIPRAITWGKALF